MKQKYSGCYKFVYVFCAIFRFLKKYAFMMTHVHHHHRRIQTPRNVSVSSPVLIGKGSHGSVFMENINDEVYACKRIARPSHCNPLEFLLFRQFYRAHGVATYARITADAEEINNSYIELAMPMGMDLDDWLIMQYKKNEHPSSEVLEDIFAQLIDQLHWLHVHGINHCDIKPKNVIVYPRNDGTAMMRAVLIDFGSAVFSIRHDKDRVFVDFYVGVKNGVPRTTCDHRPPENFFPVLSSSTKRSRRDFFTYSTAVDVYSFCMMIVTACSIVADGCASPLPWHTCYLALLRPAAKCRHCIELLSCCERHKTLESCLREYLQINNGNNNQQSSHTTEELYEHIAKEQQLSNKKKKKSNDDRDIDDTDEDKDDDTEGEIISATLIEIAVLLTHHNSQAIAKSVVPRIITNSSWVEVAVKGTSRDPHVRPSAADIIANTTTNADTVAEVNTILADVSGIPCIVATTTTTTTNDVNEYIDEHRCKRLLRRLIGYQTLAHRPIPIDLSEDVMFEKSLQPFLSTVLKHFASIEGRHLHLKRICSLASSLWFRTVEQKTLIDMFYQMSNDEVHLFMSKNIALSTAKIFEHWQRCYTEFLSEVIVVDDIMDELWNGLQRACHK
jgi:serine/threonine protein kinase